MGFLLLCPTAALFGLISLSGCVHYEASAPDPSQLAQFSALDANGAVGALNLFQTNRQAQYSPGDPEFGTERANITGDQALDLYLSIAGPIVEQLGGRIVFDTPVDQVMVGPSDPDWNRAVIVYFPTRKAFLALGANEVFQAASRHRRASHSNYLMLHLNGDPFAE